VEEVGSPDGVIVIDGSGFPKKGEDSVGVARQWCGLSLATEIRVDLAKLSACDSRSWTRRRGTAIRWMKAGLELTLQPPQDVLERADARMRGHARPISRHAHLRALPTRRGLPHSVRHVRLPLCDLHPLLPLPGHVFAGVPR